MENNKENLRELIEKFMDPQNTQMYLDDIEAGEQILRKYPAPKPDDMLLANIKANIALKQVPQRTVTFRKRVLEAIAVAASIIIIAAISLQSINETPPLPPNPPIDTSRIVGFDYNNPLIPILNNQLDELSKKIVKISMDTTTYDYEPSAYDEYNQEIQELENRIYSAGAVQDEYTYTDINKSSIYEHLDNLENQIKEINDSIWQNDYSNSDAFEI